MLRKLFGRRAGKSVVMAAAGALLLVTAAALPGGVALADGPDDAPLSSSVNAGVGAGAGPGVSPAGGGASGGGSDTAGGVMRQNVFKGHAFNTGRESAAGLPLVACLGGCEDGYVSEPIIVAFGGRYSGLTVERPAASSGVVEAITFWLGEGDSRVKSDQTVTFQDGVLIRDLALNFGEVPDANAAAADAVTADTAAVAGSTTEASGMAAGAGGGDWRTTDLTLPDAADLGLVPANSAAGFAATTFRYGGYPLLPGLVMALGLTVAGIGASLLMYRRRRIVW